MSNNDLLYVILPPPFPKKNSNETIVQFTYKTMFGLLLQIITGPIVELA